MARVAAEVVDADILRKISVLNHRSHARVVVLSARQFQAAGAKDHNVILIGGRRSNLWVELFERDMNFQIRYDAAARAVINSKPLPGEQAVYSLQASSGESVDDYGLVGFLPNLRRTGSTLVISATGRAGLEACGEFLTDETLLSQVWKPSSSASPSLRLFSTPAAPSDPHPRFELPLPEPRANPLFSQALCGEFTANSLVPLPGHRYSCPRRSGLCIFGSGSPRWEPWQRVSSQG
jgi:hypothetical protein